jgi:hypothetical protein
VQDAVWLVLVGFNDLCESSKVIERVQGGWGVENGVWRWKRGFLGGRFWGLVLWYPTSREKRARCGAPGVFVLGWEKT